MHLSCHVPSYSIKSQRPPQGCFRHLLLESLLREHCKTSAHRETWAAAPESSVFTVPVYILKQVYSRRDFSCLLSHPSDRFECSPIGPFLVSELTEQTLLLTKHWTKRRKVISLPNLDSADRPSLSFFITAMRGGTKSLFWQWSSQQAMNFVLSYKSLCVYYQI